MRDLLTPNKKENEKKIEDEKTRESNIYCLCKNRFFTSYDNTN